MRGESSSRRNENQICNCEQLLLLTRQYSSYCRGRPNNNAKPAASHPLSLAYAIRKTVHNVRRDIYRVLRCARDNSRDSLPRELSRGQAEFFLPVAGDNYNFSSIRILGAMRHEHEMELNSRTDRTFIRFAFILSLAE